MLSKNISLALRHLWKNKLHTAIHLLGLSIGVCACLVIYLIVDFELSFNKQIQGYDRIYRIYSTFSGSFSGVNRGVPGATGAAIKNEFTGVESVAPFQEFSSKLTIPSAGNKELDRNQMVVVADPSYFDVFPSYQWLAGTKEAFHEPFKVVLTKKKAITYFDDMPLTDIIGKEIIYRDSLSVSVCGIVSDLDFNTDLDFTDFISYSTIEKSWLKENFNLEDWTSVSSGTQLFIKLAEGTPVDKLESQLPLLSKHYEEKSSGDWKNNFKAQPLADLHFNPEVGVFDHSNSPAHLPTLQILIVIAIVLLIIAAINFINLETAHAIKRAKEVGVRKVLGSSKRRLVAQFMSESIILTLVSILISLPLAQLSLSLFSDFVPAGVALNVIELIPFLLMTTLVVGFLAGLYPAFVLSSFLPVIALKSNSGTGVKSGTTFLRKALIVFQFTFAQVLIIGTLIIGSQIRFMLNKDLGFKKDAVIFFSVPWYENISKRDVLVNELNQITEISEMALSQSPPSYNGWSSSTVKYKRDTTEIVTNGFQKYGDTRYIDFYGLQLIAGRNVLQSDTVKEIVINETMVRELGFETPIDALDEMVTFNSRTIPIVGVVKDFHIQSLHHVVEPVMIANEESRFRGVNLRFGTQGKNADALKPALDKVESAWNKVYPDQKINYQFLDDTIGNFYRTERRTSKLINIATALAILISCLGLLGLASYTTVQRTKEIGIRKVLGATMQNIVMLLSKEFILLVLLAFLIASPLAWMAANKWLSDFAFHIEVSILVLAIGGLIALIITFLTVGFQTIKAANQNPVNSLRTE